MKKFIIPLISLLFLYACKPRYITKSEFAPKMYDERPLALVVLPPINKSTAADAKDYYSVTVAAPLTNAGYYVFPIEVVTDVLQQEGLSDTETLLSVPVQKFREFFGADAVMYVTILKWNTSYLILSGSVTVEIACEIKSTKSGETLWYYNDEISVSTEGDNNNIGGVAGLLAKAVATAVKTAVTDYVPIASEVNARIFLAMPFGKYHKNFGEDKKYQIIKKAKPATK
jgi:hypothetical protein